MNWIHSWSGLLFGWLLFAVFLTGTLTVFDSEITSWMQPELLEVSSAARDGDETWPPVTELASQTDYWGVDVPTGRPPLLLVKLQKNRTFSGQATDPATGKMVTFRDTEGGDFFYHFHHGLLLGVPGAWIVGSAGMVMLITLVSGLGIHRWSLKDVFVFRPRSF
ncbi:MAG TPA: PepSY-associated TM helix domain-containing protein, partial [Nitrospiraceae bacterium]|nr:PepSY-associated TM helix domain-containing protein [Nitrospiraceae bacterium]